LVGDSARENAGREFGQAGPANSQR
jgi:hypothetical protein